MDSSRIFVRGLPPNLTPDDFVRHFSKDLPITDAKLIPHRRIGYVGYKSPMDAARAVKYHNKTFIRMSRIGVELACSPREIESRHAQRTQEDATTRTPDAARSSLETPPGQTHKKRKLGGKEGTKFEEYLNVMQPPTKLVKFTEEENAVGHQDNKPDSPNAARVSDERHLLTDQKPSIKSILEPSKTAVGGLNQSIDDSQGPVPDDGCFENSQKEGSGAPARPAASDEDWIRFKTSRTLDLVDHDDAVLVAGAADAGSTESDPKVATSQHPNISRVLVSITESDNAQPHNVEIEDALSSQDRESLHTGRLFIRNLAYKTTEEELRRLFESRNFGSIEEVHVPLDYRSSGGKGYAYIQYSDRVAAQHALEELDGTSFQGRLLHIMPANSKRANDVNEFSLSKLPLKKQQQIKRRTEAESSTFNWNSMFMNTDAIMSSISERFSIAKSELLDPTSSNAAIKQAHAETHIIQETKNYFSANGVDLDAFKQKDRGDTTLLVKNFPYELKAEDLRALLSAYGTISKLLVPPSGTIAIVEFDHADQARAAFKGLAYRKIKDSILFLEKAPAKLFTGEITQKTETVAKMPATEVMEPKDDHFQGESSTLFVRNLNFATNTDRLRKTFEPIDGLLSARVKTKPDPKQPGKVLSMGFGFLEFRTKQHAQAALAAMDGHNLDGHQLLIRFSYKTADTAEQRRKEDHAKKLSGNKSKIIIKNLPFEASKKDVRSLFGPYGQLRSVRVPKKFNMSTRGFAFAEFVTPREAENAISALKDTHLLGRRLVLEFAAEEAMDPEQEIANMQRKVGSQADKVALQQLTGTGRKKFNAGEADELQSG